MNRPVRLSLIILGSLAVTSSAAGQSNPPTQPKDKGVAPAASITKSTKDPEAERVIRERRAQAQALLISLAADVGNYNDPILRARTQARIADALWDADVERARTLFRKAWDAAESADKESQRRLQEEMDQQRAKNGGNIAVTVPPNLRGEVLRLAARRDRALGEEFLAKFKIEKQEEVTEAADRKRPPNPFDTPEALAQRLNLARQLLDTDVERALQFADPALGSVTRDAVNFLSYLRDKDPVAADQRYAALLRMAAGNYQSDANTISLLSSYLFTPHMFVNFSAGGASTMSTASPTSPPSVAPDLRMAFFRAASDVLLRPLPAPGQDQTSAGPEGKYLMIKRLLPLFEQYTTPEMTEPIRAQMDALASALPDDRRQRDEDSVREGIQAPRSSEDREQAIQDRIDRAKTSAERDALYIQLARVVAERGDLRVHDVVDKVEDTELRKKLRAYIDMTLTLRAVDKKDTDRILEMTKSGELTHLQRAWALTQAAKLSRADREKSLGLLDEAGTEARRIDTSDPDRARALMGVANVLFSIDRTRGWEATQEAVKAGNSAETFTGEDGVIGTSLITRTGSSIRSSSVAEFNVGDLFTLLTKEDYNRAVELARGFEREAPRASSVIAIARTVLSEKVK